MNVAQLLYKLRIITNVEIVVPLLPEMLGVPHQASRYSLLQRLQRISQGVNIPTQARPGLEWATVAMRFTEQHMDMLGHDDISVNLESGNAPHSLQG